MIVVTDFLYLAKHNDVWQGQSTYQGPSTLGLGGFAVSGGFTSVNGSNPALSSGQPPPPYHALPLPVVKATPVKSQSPPQPTPQLMQMGMSGQPMMMVGSPLQPVQVCCVCVVMGDGSWR